MKKSNIIYLVYVVFIIAIAIYFSFWIIEQSKLRYELIAPEFSEGVGECPCKKIGVESSYCKILFHKDSENPALYLELLPDVEQIFDGFGVCIPPTTVKINSHGFRDYEYPTDKPNNTFRIITLGDSYTFGQGVELNETYPKILERLLNERNDGLKYEVLNFGVGGYNVAEKVEVLSYKAIKFDPDLVIFQYLDDDILNWTEFRQIEKEKMQEYAQKINKNVSELTGLQEQMVHLNTYREYLRKLKTERFDKTWKIVEKSFERLASITQNKTVLLLADGDELQLSRLDKICQTYGWPILHKKEFLQKFPEEKLIIHPKDPHPTAFANSLIAKEIYKKLILKNLLPA